MNTPSKTGVKIGLAAGLFTGPFIIAMVPAITKRGIPAFLVTYALITGVAAASGYAIGKVKENKAE